MDIIKKYKRRFLCVNNQDGLAALLTVLIIAVAALTMALNASLLGLGELDLGYTNQKGGETLSVADACVNESMRRLRMDADFQGGSFNVGSGSCIIDIVANANNRQINVTSTVDQFNKKIKVEAVLSGSNTDITSWRETNE